MLTFSGSRDGESVKEMVFKQWSMDSSIDLVAVRSFHIVYHVQSLLLYLKSTHLLALQQVSAVL